MANLGAIGKGRAGVGPSFVVPNWWATVSALQRGLGRAPTGPSRPLPQWETDGPNSTNANQLIDAVLFGPLLNVDVSGTLSGTVKVLNVLTQGVMVEVLWRESGALINRTFTDANGFWSMTGLRVGYAGYTVIYRAPPGSPVFNDLIIDRALPV